MNTTECEESNLEKQKNFKKNTNIGIDYFW